MCALVHHVSTELSGPGRHDGGTRIGRVSHDDPEVDDPVRAGVRETVGPMGPGRALFRKALATSLPRWPRKITLDGHTPSHQALRLLRRENPRWKYVLVRNCPYLNNIVEQDHRAIKRRCASMLGFKSLGNASITLAGIELAHRIHKRQFSFGPGRQWRTQSLKQLWDRALVSA